MSDIQTIFDEYTAQHGHAPNATQLARVAGIKYREASLFLRAIKEERSHTKPRSQTITYTKPTKVAFSSHTKVRTSSFSDEVLYGDQSKPSSSSPAVDYSGSTTGANNPWKKFQKKSKSSSTFSPSFMSTKPMSLPKSKKAQDAPATSTGVSSSKSMQTVSVAQSVTSPLRTKAKSVKKKRDNTTLSKSMPSLNVSALQSDLISLNERYERECKDIRRQFEEIRSELTKKENVIIGNLTKYTNECRSILERNINKMETQYKSMTNEAKEPEDYVDIEDVLEVNDVQTTQKKEAPKKEVQSASSRSTVKTFAPKVSNPSPDVDSDEWSNSDEASW